MGAKKTLRELGFTDYESRVLMFLNSQEEEKSAKEISKGSDVPLTKLYSILLDLEKRDLVEKLPGERNHYRISGKKNLIESLREEKEEEIKEKKKELESLLENLDSNLQERGSREVSVNYFTSDERYWKAYNNEVSKLEEGEVYRIINNSRWAVSFLPEEIENNPGLESMIKGDIKKRLGSKFILHHIVNPEKLVQNIIEDLGEKEKIKKSIAQILYYYDKPELKETHYIDLAPELKNVLIAVFKSSVFIEFYSKGESVSLSSAIQIKSKEVAEDFARWFDNFSKDKNDPERDYKEFKREILKNANKLANIDSEEVEKALKEVEPFYFL